MRGWLRVRVTTCHGAPARGAKVTLHTKTGRQTRAIDAGSGYLCQMEPVAHFGLDHDIPLRQVQNIIFASFIVTAFTTCNPHIKHVAHNFHA